MEKKMKENEKDIRCPSCGIFFEQTTGREIDLLRIKNLETEEIVKVIKMCSHCEILHFTGLNI